MCEYFINVIGLMKTQVISKLETLLLFCDIINTVWQQSKAILFHKFDCKSPKKNRVAQSDIIPSLHITAFGNISGIEMACCHIRAKITFYRCSVQFLPDLMSMKLHSFTLFFKKGLS